MYMWVFWHRPLFCVFVSLPEWFNEYFNGIFYDIFQFPSRNLAYTSINRTFPKPSKNIPTEDFRWIFQKIYNGTFRVILHKYSRNISVASLKNFFSIPPQHFWNTTGIFHKLLRERFNEYVKEIFYEIFQYPSRNLAYTSRIEHSLSLSKIFQWKISDQYFRKSVKCVYYY